MSVFFATGGGETCMRDTAALGGATSRKNFGSGETSRPLRVIKTTRAAPATTTPPHIAAPWAVRRLTPTECERLQGFPDGWTKIAYRGKPADKCPDGPRYKALGNSWGVNAGEYVFDRIRMAEGLA